MQKAPSQSQKSGAKQSCVRPTTHTTSPSLRVEVCVINSVNRKIVTSMFLKSCQTFCFPNWSLRSVPDLSRRDCASTRTSRPCFLCPMTASVAPVPKKDGLFG